MTTPHFVYVTGIQHEGVCRCEPNQPRGAAPHVTGVRTEGQSKGVNEDEEGQPHSGMEGVSPQEHRSLFSAPKLRLPPLLPWTNQQTISPLWSDYPSAPPGSTAGLHSSPSLNRALSPLCSGPGCSLSPSLAVSSLKQQLPEAHQDPSSHPHEMRFSSV